MKLSRLITRLLTLTVAILLASCNSLSGFLFYPDTTHYRTPDTLGVPFEIVELRTPEGFVLHNWLLKPKKPATHSVLFLHGNGENISTHMGSVAWLSEQNVEIFLLDYRGYGLSSGASTLASSVQDIRLAHEWLTHHRPHQPLIIFGQSMGGALAIYYTAHADPALKKIDALISESAPSGWPRVAREVMSRHWLTWLLQAPASLITTTYDAEDAITEIRGTPMLLIHSRDDPVVPFHHFTRLVNKLETELLAESRVRLKTIETSGRHIAALRLKENRDRMLDFIRQTTP